MDIDMKQYILLVSLPNLPQGTLFTLIEGATGYGYECTSDDGNRWWYEKNVIEQSPNLFKEKSIYDKLDLLNRINPILKNKPMDKKIKGYKAPYDMFSWGIKKGDLMIKAKEGQDYHVDGYLPSKLPSEIVETWEPVYEETPFDDLMELVKSFTPIQRTAWDNLKNIYGKSDLEKAFNAARESLGITGSRVKHESFEDYYATLDK